MANAQRVLLYSYNIIVAVSAAISWVGTLRSGNRGARNSNGIRPKGPRSCNVFGGGWRPSARRPSADRRPSTRPSRPSAGVQWVGRTVGTVGRSADARAPHGRVQRKQQTPYSAAPRLTTYIVIVICYYSY